MKIKMPITQKSVTFNVVCNVTFTNSETTSWSVCFTVKFLLSTSTIVHYTAINSKTQGMGTALQFLYLLVALHHTRLSQNGTKKRDKPATDERSDRR